jgi:hypothetical protein
MSARIIRYYSAWSLSDQRWIHAFEVRTLGDVEFSATLAESSLQFVDWLDPARSWALARRSR